MKGSVRPAVVLLVLSVALAACRRRGDDRAADSPVVEVAHGRVASLNLRIVDAESVPVTRAERGQLLQTEVTLANASNHPLWVNKRLTLNTDEAAPYAREVWIKVLGPKQTPVPYHCITDVALPKPDDYVVLKPRDHVRRTDEMDCFDLSSPGTYVLMAKYKDGNEEPPPAPAGATHLFEEFASAMVKLEIVP
jgi:hypothetical protein